MKGILPSARSQTVQHGAVSIIIVVLLATAVMTVLLFALRQSNTELLDSYRQTDSTAALFLAESGLEDAAYRFQTLTCSDPGVVKAATALATGTYEITNPVPSGSDCVVQVTGRVNQSVRTIEATLTPASAAVTAWAVGNNGVLMQRSSAGVWSLVTPSLATDALQGVTCSTSSDCWIVGDKGVIFHWSGSATWTSYTFNTAEDYIDVACAPGNSNQCFLAGKGVADGMTRLWNGSWQAEVAAGKSLTAIDCPSTVCYAVGVEGYAQRYDGTNWSSPETSTLAETIEDVSCYDDSHCWGATKSQGNNFVVANRDGSALWQEFNISSSAKKDLNGISCSSSSECWAVGTNGRVVHYIGGVWSYYGALSPQELTAIHCQSDGNCLAVAKNGQVYFWDSDISSWAAESSPTPHRLNSVYLMDSSGGGGGANVTISRWLEVVNGS